MKKDSMTMSGSAVYSGSLFISVAVSRLRMSSLRLAVNIAALFSRILEEKITPSQALCLVNLMLALVLAIFPVSMPMLLRVVFIVWLGLALRACRQSGLR